MTQKLLVLNTDRVAAYQYILELEQAIAALAPDIHEAVDQSSETWHDNAPFEILRDRRSSLLNEIRNIKAILHNSTSRIPEVDADVVDVAKKVSVRNMKSRELNTYFITGDWSLDSGKIVEDAMVISRKSPLASQLIGCRKGDDLVFNGLQLLIENVFRTEQDVERTAV